MWVAAACAQIFNAGKKKYSEISKISFSWWLFWIISMVLKLFKERVQRQRLSFSSTWHMVGLREATIVCVFSFVLGDAVWWTAVVMYLVKVDSSTSCRPSHGSSADSAESVCDLHTENLMTSSNENRRSVSTVWVFIAAVLPMLPVPAALVQYYMLTE